MRAFQFLLALLFFTVSTSAFAVRVKDLADLKGVRDNQLIGYGLVVGLAGTGDDASAPFSSEAVATMLERLGTQVDASKLRLRNVAAVIVTARLPAFVQPGQKLDVIASSIGTAKSLAGGTLLMTPLKGPDMQVYAVAQGPISTGSFSVEGGSGSSVTKNHPTVGRLPEGALVEKAIPVDLMRQDLAIQLRTPDFINASRIGEAIVDALMPDPVIELDARGRPKRKSKQQEAAEAEARVNQRKSLQGLVTVNDGGRVTVRVPEEYQNRVPLMMAKIEQAKVVTDVPTRVVINERTGTVVLGGEITLSAVALAHGGLTIEVRESSEVSQPNAFGQGETVVTPRSELSATEAEGDLRSLGPAPSLSDVVTSLNALGVKPRDLVAILQMLKASGALNAELRIE